MVIALKKHIETSEEVDRIVRAELPPIPSGKAKNEGKSSQFKFFSKRSKLRENEEAARDRGKDDGAQAMSGRFESLLSP